MIGFCNWIRKRYFGNTLKIKHFTILKQHCSDQGKEKNRKKAVREASRYNQEERFQEENRTGFGSASRLYVRNAV